MNPKTDNEITESQWMAALEEARPKPPPGSKTTAEVAKIWKMTERRAMPLLKVLEQKGKYKRLRVGNPTYWYPSDR